MVYRDLSDLHALAGLREFTEGRAWTHTEGAEGCVAPDGFHVHVRELLAVEDTISVTVQIQDA